jgi:hypothetical protein
MGYVYVGFDYKNRKNGYLKIGETGQKSLSTRLSNIRQYDSFQCLGYLELHNETKSERLFVESFVRMMLERNNKELTQVQNDHFAYKIEQGNKYKQAQEYANNALQYAQNACLIANIQHTIGTKTYKRS